MRSQRPKFLTSVTNQKDCSIVLSCFLNKGELTIIQGEKKTHVLTSVKMGKTYYVIFQVLQAFWWRVGCQKGALLCLISKTYKILQIRKSHRSSVCVCSSLSRVRLHELQQPPRLLCPRNSPGRNTGVDCHSLPHWIFPTQGFDPGLLHRRQILLSPELQGSPNFMHIKCQVDILGLKTGNDGCNNS